MMTLRFQRTMTDLALAALFGPLMPARIEQSAPAQTTEVEELMNVVSGVLTFRLSDGSLVGVPCETITAVEAL